MPGALAPKRSIDTESSAQRSQPNDAAASTASVGDVGGQHLVLGVVVDGSRTASQHGIDTTRTRMPSASSSGFGVEAHRDLAAGADEHDVEIVVGVLDAVAVAQDVRAIAQAARLLGGAVEHGRSWRVRISAGRARRCSTATCQATAVSLASAGRMTRRPGMARSGGEVLDRLVGGAVLAEADRVVRPRVDDLGLADARRGGRRRACSR